jgi:hypothetical protein
MLDDDKVLQSFPGGHFDSLDRAKETLDAEKELNNSTNFGKNSR